MTNILATFSLSQLKQAVAIREQLEKLQSQLNDLAGHPGTDSSSSTSRGKMSAAGRARISAAAKARWAKFHASKGKSAIAKPAKKFTMSAAARAKISAAAKARWAKVKAGKKK